MDFRGHDGKYNQIASQIETGALCKRCDERQLSILSHMKWDRPMKLA
jgi:hypothetical protein